MSYLYTVEQQDREQESINQATLDIMIANIHNLKTIDLMRPKQGNCKTTKMPLTVSQKLALPVDEEFAAQIEAYEAQQSAWWLD